MRMLCVFVVCKCVSYKKCGRDFAKFGLCSDVTMTVCGVGLDYASLW